MQFLLRIDHVVLRINPERETDRMRVPIQRETAHDFHARSESKNGRSFRTEMTRLIGHSTLAGKENQFRIFE